MDDVFAALGHPDRRRVLVLVKRQGEMAAGELAEHFGFSKPTLSHHLNQLVAAGLLDREKRGQFVYYRINQTVFEEVLQVMFDLFEIGRPDGSAKRGAKS